MLANGLVCLLFKLLISCKIGLLSYETSLFACKTGLFNFKTSLFTSETGCLFMIRVCLHVKPVPVVGWCADQTLSVLGLEKGQAVVERGLQGYST